MPEETLILKRNPEAVRSEGYDVFFEGRHVGRIYKAVSHAPREAPWFWGLDFFEWQGSDGPEYLGLIHRRIAKIPYIHLPGHIRFEPFGSKTDAVLMWLNAFFTSPLIIYECQKCDRSNIRGRQPWKPRISLNNGATCRRCF